MQRKKGVARSEDHQMETKGKRPGRIARPENPIPQAVPAETPIQIQPDEAAEQELAVGPSPPDVAIRRRTSLAPTISATCGGLTDFGGKTLVAAEESRAAMARWFDALSEVMAGLARLGIDTVTRTAIEMLAVKSLSDAIAVNGSFARASFDNWIGGSAKFSELGVKLAVESSRPFLAHLGESWGCTAHPGGSRSEERITP
jgi:Phasin protein